MRGTTFTASTTLVVEECCSCGVTFAMPQDFKEFKLRHRNDPKRNSFYCPNGHDQHYLGESPDAKIRRLEAKVVDLCFELSDPRPGPTGRRRAIRSGVQRSPHPNEETGRSRSVSLL